MEQRFLCTWNGTLWTIWSVPGRDAAGAETTSCRGMQRKRDQQGVQSVPPDQPYLRTGGLLSDSTCAFSRDGLFVLCPRGREISVISTSTGARVSAITTALRDCIESVVRFDVDGKDEYFASLDAGSHVNVWSWNGKPREAQTSAWTPHTTLDLDALVGTWASSNGVVPEHRSDRAIVAVHPYAGPLRTPDSSGLVVVVRSILSVCSVGTTSSSESQSEEEDVSPSLPQPVFEVFDVPKILSTKSLPAVNFVFVCWHQGRRRGGARSAAASAVSASGKEDCSFTILASGRHIALAVYRTLYIWDRETSSIVSSYHREPFSAVTIHPNGDYVATGDDSGRVTWWYLSRLFTNKNSAGFKEEPRNSQVNALRTKVPGTVCPASGKVAELLATITGGKPSATDIPNQRTVVDIQVAIQHWHAHRVRAMAFTCDGLHLVTGGEEGVLVIWHVSQTERQFVPRLRAPVHTITTAPGHPWVAACLADNSLAVVDSSCSKIKAVFQSVQLPLSLIPGTSRRAPALRAKKSDVLPITVQPFSATYPTQALFVGSGVTSDGLGPNTGLQIYDILADRSLGSFHVNKQNFVYRDQSRTHQWTVQQVRVITKHLTPAPQTPLRFFRLL